ncbi:aldehyde dehydrogenase [Sesbania bispinosa]|nr:aldehyde dehydrogenase [Sesbania bispinosa]
MVRVWGRRLGVGGCCCGVEAEIDGSTNIIDGFLEGLATETRMHIVETVYDGSCRFRQRGGSLMF